VRVSREPSSPLPPEYGNHPSHRFGRTGHVRASKSTKASLRLLPCKHTFVLIVKFYFSSPPAPSPPRTSHLKLRLPCTTTSHAYPVPIHLGQNKSLLRLPGTTTAVRKRTNRPPRILTRLQAPILFSAAAEPRLLTGNPVATTLLLAAATSRAPGRRPYQHRSPHKTPGGARSVLLPSFPSRILFLRSVQILAGRRKKSAHARTMRLHLPCTAPLGLAP